MANPIATTNPPSGGPVATGGVPQKPSRPVQVKGHSRTAPTPRAPLKIQGLSAGQVRYWMNRLGSGAGVHQIERARNRQIALHNPDAFGPGGGLSPLQANLQSAAAARLKYGPTLATDRQQTANIPAWYQAYQQQVAQLQQQAAQNSQNAVAGINTQGAQIAGQQQQLQQQALAAMGQDAASRGAAVDPSLAASSSQFQAGLNALNASDAARTAAVGTSQQQYLGNLGQIQQAAGQQNLTRAQKQLSLDQQAAADYQNQFRQGLIQNAQKQSDVLQTLNAGSVKANQTFQTNQQKLKLANKIANADATHQQNQDTIAKGTMEYKRMEADRTFGLNRKKYGLAYARDQYQKQHSLGPYKPAATKTGGLTPLQQRQQQQNQTKIRNQASDDFKTALGLLRGQNPQIKTPADVQKEADLLSSSKYHIPPDLAYAAAQTFAFGGVGPGTGRVVQKRFGLKLGQFTPKAHG